jgi:hypothetical protein
MLRLDVGRRCPPAREERGMTTAYEFQKVYQSLPEDVQKQVFDAAYDRVAYVLPQDATSEQRAVAVTFLLKGMIHGLPPHYARDMLTRFGERG